MFTPVLSKPEHEAPSMVDGENENVEGLSKAGGFDISKFAQNADSLQYLATRRSKIIKRLNPSGNARALLELGDIHRAKKNFNAAEKAYRDAIRKDPHLVDAYKKLIPLLLIKQDKESANNYYLKLTQITNNHHQIVHEHLLFKMSFHADIPGNLSDVEKGLSKLVKDNPEKADYLNSLGVLELIFKGDVKAAENHFSGALRLQPDNIHSINNLGICYQRQKKYSGAIKLYRQANEIDPRYSAAYENLASSYIDQKKLGLALSALLDSKENGAKLSSLWDHNTGWLMLLTEKFEDAMLWYKTKLKEEPNNNLLLNNLGVCYDKLNEPKKAYDCFEKAVNIAVILKKTKNHVDKRSLNAFHNLCRKLVEKDDYKLLERVAKLSVFYNANNPASLYFLGTSRIQLKNYAAAAENLEKSLDIYPDAVEPYIDLSFIYTSISHEFDKAIQLLKKAISKKFDHEYILNNLAFAYVKKGNIEMAEKTLSFKEKYPNTTATRGLIELYKGNYTLGNEYYGKALNQLKDDKKDLATQIWRYEQAAYWYRKGNKKKCLKFIEKSKELGDKSFIFDDIINLEKKAEGL